MAPIFANPGSRRQRFLRRARLGLEQLETRLAPAGALDPMFGNDGVVLFGSSPLTNWDVSNLLVQQEGKLLVLGSVQDGTETRGVVCRFNQDGSADQTFGGGAGFVTMAAAGRVDAQQLDGKFLVSGMSGIQLTLSRCNPDGTLDLTFGGDGTVVFDPDPAERIERKFATAVAVQDDGRIVVAGYVDGDYEWTVPTTWLARFTPDGAFDPTFGGDGLADDNLQSATPGRDLTISNGKIIFSGWYIASGWDPGPFVLRYNADGTRDNAFDQDGAAHPDLHRIAPYGSGHALQFDGRIYVATRGLSDPPSRPTLGVARFQDDGRLDTDFAAGGVAFASVSADAAGSFTPVDVIVQQDGAAVVVGQRLHRPNQRDEYDIAVARVTSTGAPDPEFGPAGTAVVDSGGDDFVRAVALQGDRIIVAGRAGMQLVLAGFQSRSEVVAVPDTFQMDEDPGAVLLDVLVNDTSEVGAPLAIHSFTQPAHGSVVQVGQQLRYTPALNHSGSDAFSYVAVDGRGGLDPASVAITIRAVNDPPIANPDSATTSEGTNTLINVLANDATVDLGETLAVAAFTAPAHGAVVPAGDQLRYIPAAGFVGDDAFTYTVADGRGGQALGSVTITVRAEPPAAVDANDDLAYLDGSGTVILTVLSNDLGSTLTIQTFTQPAHGTVTRIGAGLLYITNSGDPAFRGSDLFGYVASDGQGRTDSAVMVIHFPNATTTTLSADGPVSVYGGGLAVTALVQGAVGTPTGVVQFHVNGADVGAPLLLANGQATLPLPLPAGDYNIAATYTPDTTRFQRSHAAGLNHLINPEALTIRAKGEIKPYGAAMPELTYQIIGFVNGDTAASLDSSPVLRTAATATSDVGIYPILMTGAADANYIITFIPNTVAIQPVPLTITADNQTMVAGSAVPPLTVQFSGFVNGDTAASLDLAAVASTAAWPDSPPGTYPITVTASDRNYTFTLVAGTLTILPGPPRPAAPQSPAHPSSPQSSASPSSPQSPPAPPPLRVSAPRTIIATGTVAKLRRVTLSGTSAQAQVTVRVHTTQGNLLLRMRGVKLLGHNTGRLTLIGKPSLVERALKALMLRLARPRSQATLTLTAKTGRQVWTSVIQVRRQLTMNSTIRTAS